MMLVLFPLKMFSYYFIMREKIKLEVLFSFLLLWY